MIGIFLLGWWTLTEGMVKVREVVPAEYKAGDYYYT